MRTIIFLGLLYIGDAIREVEHTEELTSFFAIICIISIAMDIIEFINNISKNHK